MKSYVKVKSSSVKKAIENYSLKHKKMQGRYIEWCNLARSKKVGIFSTEYNKCTIMFGFVFPRIKEKFPEFYSDLLCYAHSFPYQVSYYDDYLKSAEIAVDEMVYCDSDLASFVSDWSDSQ